MVWYIFFVLKRLLQVELLLQYLVRDPRCRVQFEALQCLYGLAKQGAHLWPEESVASLVKVARESPHQALVGCGLDVLIVLTKSPAVCQAHAQPGIYVVDEHCLYINRYPIIHSLHLLYI